MKLLKIALLAQFSNKKGTFILFIVPFILMLVIGSVIIASDPQKLPTAVLINDHSSFSRSLIASINQSKDHAVKYTVDSEREGHRLLQQGKIVYLMTIPPNFSRDLIRGDRPQLMIEIDATATNKALTINNALTQLVNKDLKGSLDYLAQGQPYSLVVHERYNPEGLMKYKVIPGLIGVMFMVYAVLFLQLFFIGKNRSRLGSPPQTSSALSLTVAETLPIILIQVLQTCGVPLVLVYIFKISIQGYIPLFIFGFSLYCICNVLVAYIFAVGSTEAASAIRKFAMFFTPSFLISGFLFPYVGMPQWAQIISNLLPLRYFIPISRGVILKGATFSELWIYFWPLLVLIGVLFSVAILRTKRQLAQFNKPKEVH